jgi:glycosyltransferase involved in cell wall biosynthesis
MRTSVIICSYRGNESLALSCITSLYQQSERPNEIILVVDTEKEKEKFKEYVKKGGDYSVIFLSSGKKGLAAARNVGVEASSSEILAFIDDDAIADTLWLEEIQKSFISDSNIVVTGGPVKPIFEGKTIPEKFFWIIGCTSNSPPTSRPIGCNIAVRSEIFKKIGMFDERLGRVRKKLAIGEETDLILRIQHNLPGSIISFNSKAKVFHKTPDHRVSLLYFILRAYEEGYSKALIRKKYGMQEEQKYLKYYLKHLDMTTLIVLVSTGIGYVHGRIRS